MPTISQRGRPKRKGLPKTKTGCKTCRKRRVKCGEEKPSCTRCVNFGIPCDWNPAKGPEKVWSAVRQSQLCPKNLDIAPYPKPPSVQKRMVLLPKINLMAPILVNPSKSLFNCEVEQRYFEIFASKTAFEILPSVDSSTLRQILLQACLTEPSIRHAVVALGALDKTAGSLAIFGSVSSDDQRSDPAQHHQNALKQYATAIKYMRAAALSGVQDIRTTLVTCLVVFCFEAWDGLKENAVQQIKTGLNLIQSWQEENEDGLRYSASKSNTIIEEDLIRAFSRLDVQAISFASREGHSLQRQAIIAKQERKILDRMPNIFASVQEAEVYENAIMRRTMRFIAFDVPLPRLAPPLLRVPINGWYGERSSRVVAIQQSILDQINRWDAAFEPLWRRLKAKNDPSLMIAAMLKMHQRSASMALLQICAKDEEEFDDYKDVFAEIVELAEYSLNILEESAKSSAPKFQFDSHIVIPLHIVGHKCRDRAIRRRAVSMLLSHPRREGVWDGTLAGGMIEWAMNIEEEHLEKGRVPGWARIHGITLERAPLDQPRQLIWTCEQRLGPQTEELVTRRKTIN